MTFASMSPKSSSLRFSGVFSLICEVIERCISPIAVCWPVRTTAARAAPFTTVVPCNENEDYESNICKLTHRKEHVRHVLFDRTGVGHYVYRLVYTDTFTSENGLINTEATRRYRYKSTVGWDLVANRYRNNVSWYKFTCVYTSDVTIPKNSSFVRRKFLQGLEKR